jgi:nucleoside-diphosphate-sugar epimerase
LAEVIDHCCHDLTSGEQTAKPAVTRSNWKFLCSIRRAGSKVREGDRAGRDHNLGTRIAVREWFYAPDFARVILEVVASPDIAGLHGPLNIGQNFGLSVRQLVNLIAREGDYTGKIRYDESMPDGAPRKVMDERRFRKVFPRFDFIEIGAGLSTTVAYYKSILPY